MINSSNYYTFEVFKSFKNLIAAVSSKKLGNMSFDRGGASQVIISRKRFFKSLGILPFHAVMMDIVHGSKIKIITEKDKGLGSLNDKEEIEKTDGFISNTPGIFLMTTVCDCLPILFYDSQKKVVGLAHVGFMGAKKKLVTKMIKKFVQHFKSSLKDIFVAFGPCLQECCLNNSNHKDINLISENYKQLIGIRKNNIEITKVCTVCNANFFSHRIGGGFKSPAHGVIIGIKNER